MSLAEKINTDFISAYKAKEQDKVAVLRMLKTAIKNLQIELRREPDEGEVLGIVSKQLKQRQESLEQFTQAGRDDLAGQEAVEIEILKEYMPPALSNEEVEAIVDEAVASLSAQAPSDMGRVMKHVMDEHKGRVDGKFLSELVKSKLSA